MPSPPLPQSLPKYQQFAFLKYLEKSDVSIGARIRLVGDVGFRHGGSYAAGENTTGVGLVCLRCGAIPKGGVRILIG